tara:strand:- start:832 stop:1143 length:312 start_codon:yes stop_codon:yes gene_type:complete
LQGCLLKEALLQRMKGFTLCNPLDSCNFSTFCLNAKNTARVHDATIHDDATGATVTVIATLFSASQTELLAEDLQQALARLAEEVNFLTVEVGLDVSSTCGHC